MSGERLKPQLIAEIAAILVDRCSSGGRPQLDNLFTGAGAPLPAPTGSMLPKATAWLERLSEAADVDTLGVLGRLLEGIMERRGPEEIRERVRRALAANDLRYEPGGRIVGGTVSPSKTLADRIRSRDYAALNTEFGRALDNVERDPPAALAAASGILEATFRIYIEEKGLTMPSDQSIQPLWKEVRPHLGLDVGQTEDSDMTQILGGLASIVNGVGALRTHASTAHGKGLAPPKIEPRHARLAVHAAHTVVTFVLESWD